MRFPVNPRPLYMLQRDDSNVFNAFLVRKNTPTPPPLVRFSKKIQTLRNKGNISTRHLISANF